MRIGIVFFLFILTFTSSHGVDVDPVGKEVKNGVRKYKLGDFNGSLDSFNKVEKELPNDPRLEFNKGAGQYKLSDYNSALQHFEKAFQQGDTELKAKASYNMGNTFYKMGDKRKAIEQYLNALTLNPNLEQAKRNLELIRRKEEKPPQKGSQNSENEENNEKEQQKEQGKSENDSKQNSQKNKAASEEEAEMKKQMSRAEAERILESNRQDKIKRRKAKTKWSKYDEVFW